jgi:hypothetical protein
MLRSKKLLSSFIALALVVGVMAAWAGSAQARPKKCRKGYVLVTHEKTDPVKETYEVTVEGSTVEKEVIVRRGYRKVTRCARVYKSYEGTVPEGLSDPLVGTENLQRFGAPCSDTEMEVAPDDAEDDWEATTGCKAWWKSLSLKRRRHWNLRTDRTARQALYRELFNSHAEARAFDEEGLYERLEEKATVAEVLYLARRLRRLEARVGGKCQGSKPCPPPK